MLWRDYGLVPIAYEDYGGFLVNVGEDINAYYAVAVARRRDTELTLFNLKRKYVCCMAAFGQDGVMWRL